MKGCFRFDTFMFRVSPNLAKYTNELSPPEQRHKIDPKNSPKKKTLLPSGPPTTGASVSDLSLTAAVFLARPAFLPLAVP
jgi:hypothetical protein